MNKKMEELYAQIEFLGNWTKNELQTYYADTPEQEKIYSEMLTVIGRKMLSLADELDEERKAYNNRPLWKKIFLK